MRHSALIACLFAMAACTEQATPPQETPAQETPAQTASPCAFAYWARFFEPKPQTHQTVESIDTPAGTVQAVSLGPLAGEFPKVFMFLLDGESCFTKVVVIGSYESTTQHARETGRIGPNARVFHADLYDGRAHQTLGFFEFPPNYDASKTLALKALK